MNTPSDPPGRWDELHNKIIGLGERSIRKTYYPELQAKLAELERFRSLLDQSNDGILVVSVPALTLVDANLAAFRQTGLAPLLVVGSSIMKPPGGDVLQNLGSAILHLDSQKQEKLVIQETFPGSHDQPVPVEMTVHLVRFDGERYGVVVSRDMSERLAMEAALKKSEARYRSLFHQSLEGIFQADPGGTFAIMNQAGAAILGYSSPEYVIGRTDTEFFLDTQERERFWQKLSERGAVRLYPIAWRTCKGGAVYIEISCYLVKNDEGAVTSWEGVFRDVTERKKLEQQLVQAQKMEAVGRLAGGIAHDFNNLLTVINGFANLVQGSMTVENPLYCEVEEIRKAGERAAELTNQLLLFSRQKSQVPKPVLPSTSVHSLEKMLKRIIGEDIHLSTTVAGKSGVILIDPVRFEQVLVNLVVNARDAMPSGGRLSITTRTIIVRAPLETTTGVLKTGEWSVLDVSDSGSGMTVETMNHLFEPFFTTKEPGKGTGLGLSTVYAIVQQAGGCIDVMSVLGRGTTFSVYFPLCTDKTSVQSPPGKPEKPQMGNNEWILLVEDEEMLRKLAEKILHRQKYQVLPAATPQEALTICRNSEQPIDLVLTDIVLPDMNGRELFANMQKIRPELKVLFMSGFSNQESMLHGITLTRENFIHKPFNIKTLTDRIRATLDGASPAPGLNPNP
jgi:PAS domain S-box-containing protein